jgi:hypothetical protein
MGLLELVEEQSSIPLADGACLAQLQELDDDVRTRPLIVQRIRKHVE